MSSHISDFKKLAGLIPTLPSLEEVRQDEMKLGLDSSVRGGAGLPTKGKLSTIKQPELEPKPEKKPKSDKSEEVMDDV